MTKTTGQANVPQSIDDEDESGDRDEDVEEAVHAPRSTVDDLGDYIRSVPKTPLLGSEGEVALAQEIEAAEVALWTLLIEVAKPAILDVLGERLKGVSITKKSAVTVREIARDRDCVAQVVARARSRVSPESGARLEHLHRTVLRLKDKFVVANLRLVINVAMRYRTIRMSLPDIVAEGNIGLIAAVDRFDYRRGYRFATYATWWIRHAISRAIADKGRTVRLPVHVIDALGHVRRTEETLYERLGRAPTEHEIAGCAGLSPKKLAMLRQVAQDAVSANQLAWSEGETTVLDQMPDTTIADIAERMTAEHQTERVRAAMDKLAHRHRAVLKARAEKDLTLKDIGDSMGLSRERIRQIEAEAEVQLRHHFHHPNADPDSIPRWMTLRERRDRVTREIAAHLERLGATSAPRTTLAELARAVGQDKENVRNWLRTLIANGTVLREQSVTTTRPSGSAYPHKVVTVYYRIARITTTPRTPGDRP